MDTSIKLSPHFTLGELITSTHRKIDNTPPDDVIARLRELCLNFLEPVRAKFGPLYVTSGYRCPKLNKEIGGSKTSAHMYGCAADFVPAAPDVRTTSIVAWVANDSGLNFDQVIDERSNSSVWVHLGILRPVGPEVPRREALIMRNGAYSPFKG